MDIIDFKRRPSSELVTFRTLLAECYVSISKAFSAMRSPLGPTAQIWMTVR